MPSIASGTTPGSTTPASRTRSLPSTNPASWPASSTRSGPTSCCSPSIEPLPREKEPLPDAGDLQPWDLPWALELANGDRCTLLHGTLYVQAGQTVYYGCEQNGAVLGTVDHGQPVWTVNYLADGEVASGLVDVTAAWS